MALAHLLAGVSSAPGEAASEQDPLLIRVSPCRSVSHLGLLAALRCSNYIGCLVPHRACLKSRMLVERFDTRRLSKATCVRRGNKFLGCRVAHGRLFVFC